MTDFFGSEIDRVDLNTLQVTSYKLPSANTYSPLGSMPWQIVVDARYVYGIDYGDSNVVRINKATGLIDAVPLPLTSDTEQGYGLALSAGRLYFTLSDDTQPSFGGASTFGYIDISSWEAPSAQCSPAGTDCAPSPSQAVVYSGLDHADLREMWLGQMERLRSQPFTMSFVSPVDYAVTSPTWRPGTIGSAAASRL